MSDAATSFTGTGTGPDRVPEFAVTARTTLTRARERASYDIATAYEILDEALVAHVASVSEDGRPVVLPNLHVRVDDALYLHVSTGATLATAARDGGGVPVCVTVTLIDGLVLARSAMHHSANYRCVVVHGDATLVTDPQQRDRVLAALVDHVVEGRSGACRPPSARELAATAVLRVPLVEVSVKSRAGAPRDDADDLDLPYWAGVVPLTLTAGTPVPDSAGIPLPAHISRYAGPARSSAPAAPVPA